MTIPAHYRRPVLIAVTLHVLILLAIVVRLSATAFRAPPAYQPKPFDSIQATAILPQSVTAPTPKPVQQPVDHEKQVQEKQAQEALQEKMQAQKIQHEKHVAALHAEKIQAEKLEKMAQLQAQEAAKAKKQKQAAQMAALEKRKIEKKLKQDKLAKLAKMKAEKLAKLQKQKVLTAEQQKLQQAMMQQQLNSEQKDLSQIQTQQQQGVIDKYKAQILALIQSNWRIDQVNSKLKCIFSVSVAPDGTILSVSLLTSSGNSDLDNSARQAITQSSPLPVPENPSLFDHFRQLILTLSPQGYLQSVGSA